MPTLEDITYSDDEEDVGAEADFYNLETTITVSPIPTTRVHKDHPVTQIIEEPKRVHQALKDPSWIEAMQEELLQFKMQKMDVKSAFLYGTIEEEVYVCQPLGFEDPYYPDKVYKVVKALYGLHQAPKAWYETFVYVDDIIFGSTNKDLCKAFEKLMKDKFQMSSMGELTFFLGLQVKQKKDGIFISQDKYVAKILKKFGLTDGKSARTPIDTDKPLLKDPISEDVDVHTYSFQVTPKASHLHAVKRIFRYLKSKPHLGLWYPKDSPFNLVSYSDSDYAGASLDRKSTTGGCQFIDASEGFEQILDFLNASVIKYALTVNPAIYVSCIKQFWSSVSIKKTNYVVRLQALIDRRKVIITEDTVRQALRLDDAESIDCLPNEEIFAELERMGLVRNVDSFSKFYMYPRFLQLMIDAQVGDLSSHTTKYTSLALTQKVFANMRRVGKGFYGVDTLLFEGMLVPQQVNDDVADDVATDDVANQVADVVAEDVVEPAPPSPTPAITPPPPQQEVTSTPPPSPHQSPIALPSSPQQQQASPPSQPTAISMELLNTLLETCTTLTKKVKALEQDKIAQALEITKLKQRVMRLEKNKKLKVSRLKRLKKVDEDVTLEEVDAKKDAKVAKKDAKPAEVKEVIEVVTTAKLMTEVVTAAATPITAAHNAAKRRKGVVIRDPKETATPSIIVHSEPKSKDKGKGILVEEPKPLKKQAQIEQDEAHARESTSQEEYDAFQLYCGFPGKSEKELKEEASKTLKMTSESSEQQAVKKQKLDEEVKELKTHLQIVPNDEDDVYIESTPLALKPKNFSDDFLLNTLKAMFEKPNVEDHIWKNQRGNYGLAKVKSWKLLESCGVHIITFTTSQMILLVERRYHLTRFTLDQMMNNVRLEVEEESEVSLELLRFEYTLRDYCWWYKLKLLDNAADSRLRLLEESAAADDKMKK
nr:hypothetical protein [Tanacetum cinerariifolium]